MTTRPTFSTLVEALRHRADNAEPNAAAYVYLVDGATQELRITYRELDRQARAIAAHLQRIAPRGARAVLLYPPDLNYIAAFFGCLYAGVIAVPAYPPDPGRLNRTLPRLQAIFQDADAQFVLTTSEIVGMAQFLFKQAPDLEAKTWVASDGVEPALADAWSESGTSRSDIAFLQYTSGSTGVPKGVILTHENLLHNLELISNAFRIDAQSTGVSWLPPYHDMGLIGGILAPLYKGRPTALMSPVAFLQRPLRWLEAISRFRATVSGGPNFAYDLCVRKVTPEDLERLDLRSWSLAFTGAEPVRADTIDAFVRTFGPRGFQRAAFYPCYGLAEATLIVSGGEKAAEPIVESVEAAELQSDRVVRAPAGGSNIKRIVGCGRSLGDQQVAIVNPATSEASLPGDVGEIWVAGRSVSQGYWRRADATQENFGGRVVGSDHGPFLRTGDLGFLRDGELFITGRIKDLVIIRGRNYYPQDIERTAESSHPSLRRGCCAAFAAEMQGHERLIVAVELERRYRERRKTPSSPPADSERRSTDRRSGVPQSVEEAAKQTSSLGAPAAGPFDPDGVCDAIRRAVLEHHDLSVHEVVLVTPGAIPKTSSGKIQRSACREAFLDGSLEHVASNVISVEQTRKTSIRVGDLREVVLSLTHDERVSWLEHFLKEQLAKALKTPVSRVDTARPLSTFGLDSLLAVELAHRIEKRLGVVAAATAFLRETTLKDLALSIDRELAAPSSTLSLSPTSSTKLSAGQQALWFLHQLAPASGAYNLSCALRIASDVDTEALRAAFQYLVDRHESLRTVYPAVHGEPTRRVLDTGALDFEVVTTPAHQLSRALAESAVRPFDLERGPVVRVQIHSSPDERIVQVVMHHIAADLWSIVVLLDELGAAYKAILERRPVPLKPPEPTYTDFVQWQQDYLAGSAGRAGKAHWHARHTGEQLALALPTDRPRPPLQTYRGGAHTVTFNEALVKRLREFARAHSTTPYVVLLSAFAVLLARYTGQLEVVVGSPVAGRPRAGFDRAVGYFVNVLALRMGISDRPNFSQLVAGTRTNVLDALENQHYPLSLIIEDLGLRRDPARSPLFQAFLAFEKAQLERDAALSQVVLGAAGATAKLGPLKVEAVPVEQRTAQFDISLIVIEGRSAMDARLQYNADLFDGSTVARMGVHLHTLLGAAMTDPLQAVGEIELLTPAERECLVRDWNHTTEQVPNVCVHELIEAQVGRTPNAVAVQFDRVRMSYAELNRRANQLARWLRSRGVGRDVRVGILLDRSIELVVAVLGVLKAGAAYVPLDASYPAERLAFMIRDAQLAVLLTQDRLRSGLSEEGAGIVLSLDASAAALDGLAGDDLPRVGGPDDLAYMIYTSGSTGRPKGVMVHHRGVVNFLCSMRQRPGLQADDVLLAVTSLSFDIAALEIYLPLVVGARVQMASRDEASDGVALAKLLEASSATVMQATPSTWRQMLESGWMGKRDLKALCGGEALPPLLAARMRPCVAALWNMYGPTETTIWSSTHLVDADTGPVPIGRPIANTQMYVLDERLRPLPVGVVGEIHIGGTGVASGYWRQDELTAERFVRDPFTAGANHRLYKTGDLGRWLPAGVLEHLGRIDHQVKLRGFRIELGEIEVSLMRHELVREAVVLAWDDARGDARLVAYVVGRNGSADVSAGVLRDFLKKQLPEYMIPSAFVLIDSIPLLPNGKIDRNGLPVAEVGGDADFVGPRSPLEEELCEIVREVLGVQQVGIHTNFFELGGHSLMLTRVANRIRSQFGVDVPMADLFEGATVARMALSVAKARAAALEGDIESILTEVESLSPEELDRLLAGRSKHG